MLTFENARAQREELEKRLSAQKSTKSKEFVVKFKQDVLENGMPASCANLRGLELSAEERAQVCGAPSLLFATFVASSQCTLCRVPVCHIVERAWPCVISASLS